METICETCGRYPFCNKVDRSRGEACKDYKKAKKKGDRSKCQTEQDK